jgi:hypothetical protein
MEHTLKSPDGKVTIFIEDDGPRSETFKMSVYDIERQRETHARLSKEDIRNLVAQWKE